MIANADVANVYLRRNNGKRRVLPCNVGAMPENPGMASAMADEVETVYFLGVKDAESVILCSRFTIHNLFDRGVLKGHKIGRNRRIRVDSIREYLAGDEYRIGLLEAKLAQLSHKRK